MDPGIISGVKHQTPKLMGYQVRATTWGHDIRIVEIRDGPTAGSRRWMESRMMWTTIPTEICALPSQVL